MQDSSPSSHREATTHELLLLWLWQSKKKKGTDASSVRFLSSLLMTAIPRQVPHELILQHRTAVHAHVHDRKRSFLPKWPGTCFTQPTLVNLLNLASSICIFPCTTTARLCSMSTTMLHGAMSGRLFRSLGPIVLPVTDLLTTGPPRNRPAARVPSCSGDIMASWYCASQQSHALWW